MKTFIRICFLVGVFATVAGFLLGFGLFAFGVPMAAVHFAFGVSATGFITAAVSACLASALYGI